MYEKEFFLGAVWVACMNITIQAQVYVPIEIVVGDDIDLDEPAYSYCKIVPLDIYTTFEASILSTEGPISASLDISIFFYLSICRSSVYLTSSPTPGSVTHAKVSAECSYSYSAPAITGLNCHSCKGCGKAGHTPPEGGMHCIQHGYSTGIVDFTIISLDIEWISNTILYLDIGDVFTLRAKGSPGNINGTYEWVSDKREPIETESGVVSLRCKYEDEYIYVRYKYKGKSATTERAIRIKKFD